MSSPIYSEKVLNFLSTSKLLKQVYVKLYLTKCEREDRDAKRGNERRHEWYSVYKFFFFFENKIEYINMTVKMIWRFVYAFLSIQYFEFDTSLKKFSSPIRTGIAKSST